MARYKARVLKRFPAATPTVVTRTSDGSPYHIAICVDGSPIDIYDDGRRQLHGAAWRSAFYWCVRNPTQEYRELAVRLGISVVEI